MKETQNRKSIRLKGFDYASNGGYFVTIVTWQRIPLFGRVMNGTVTLNPLGEIARAEWFKSALLRENLKLRPDEFIVMPNHIHGIVWLEKDSLSGNNEVFGRPVPGSLPTIVRAYKSAVTYAINQLDRNQKRKIWQRNYYEHGVRDEDDWNQIWDYILSNPANWQNDENCHP